MIRLALRKRGPPAGAISNSKIVLVFAHACSWERKTSCPSESDRDTVLVSPDWLRIKNPAAPVVTREAEENAKERWW